VTAPEELPISDARDHFADVLGRATYAGQITYITKRGQRVGAVVPVDVAEAAEAAEDAYLSRLAREAEEELAQGAPTRPLGDLVEEYDLGVPSPRQRSAGPTFERPRSAATGGRRSSGIPPIRDHTPAEDSATPGDANPRQRP
jgi:antitoxin Phd